MSLVELIVRADDRGLRASGLACLDRCLPLLDGDDEVLRPLWAALAGTGPAGDGHAWAQALGRARDSLAGPAATGEDEAVLLARRMLAAAPADRTGVELRAWADACSVASLRIHRILDPALPGSAPSRAGTAARAVETAPAGDASPLAAGELRRQIAVLELLAGHGAAGLRGAVDVSTEGRRILRAVVSRRARGARGRS
ncbi:hypothetical protein AB0O68_11615 [Streptomyces sp. NPDC087512]|uniref:hypothetical protein n=1 Tax=Streptomyces sp. NPDC087512 TaxID=3155059 RepID=UPI003421FA37